ncbi:MAG: ATP-binding protein [Myxococcales bacterium]|nr:ATP-binding protein [Myxococcales bacterium]
MSDPEDSRELPEAAQVSKSQLADALNGVLAGSLRPVCVGLALFYALLTAWYLYRLEGDTRETMALSTGLLSVGLLAGAVWFERNRVPGWLAHPASSVIGVAVIVNCLFLLVSVPEPHMTTNLMIAVLGFGCLLLSMRWFAGLCGLAIAGWAWVVGARADDPEWYHFGLALGEATLFGFLILIVRIRAYKNIQTLHLRDQRLMQHLREANAAALVAVKAKSEFLANMSHEIRTPMTAMLGMTELLQMSKLDEAQKEFADTIERSGNTLLQLVNDILDFSKIEAGQLTIEEVRFNLRTLLEEVQRMLDVKARQKGLKFEVEIDESIPLRYRGDPTRIKQVLVNLMGNAIKFTHDGGVKLRATGRELEGNRRMLDLSVVDTGIGIAPDQIEQVFEAFTQADASTTRKFGGTGLGLAISNQLTKLMGGELRVESKPDEGSVFTMSLALPEAVHRSTIPEPIDETLARYTGRVLLVEDNEDNQVLALELLGRFGCEVEMALDGQQAIDRLEHDDFDLVLMDCHMPNMNGYDATKEIRRREGDNGQHTTIVALTASVLPEERERCRAVGMDDYIAKPFSKRDLQDVLEKYL